MELDVPGPMHDDYRELLGQIVRVIAQELEIPMSSRGETTWIRPEIERGIEADHSYYFLPKNWQWPGLPGLAGRTTFADYPNPDLAIEVDISPPQVDGPGIYAKLQVTEVWRFDGHALTIERLNEAGRYVPVDASGFLEVQADAVTPWLIGEDSWDKTAWARRPECSGSREPPPLARRESKGCNTCSRRDREELFQRRERGRVGQQPHRGVGEHDMKTAPGRGLRCLSRQVP